MNNLDSRYRDYLDPALLEGFDSLRGLVNQESVFQQILAWTNGQPELTVYICNRLIHSAAQNESAINETTTNQLVQDTLTIDLLQSVEPQDLPVVRLLKQIEEALTRKELDWDPLVAYRSLLQSGRQTIYNNAFEQNQLIKIGVAATHADGKLSIANPIYRQIFDLNWVDHQIEKRTNHQAIDKYHLALITGLISILLFSLFQGFMRYSPYARLLQCHSNSAYKDAIDANISLDENKIEQSIQTLKDLQSKRELAENCQFLLYDLQYSQAIYISAGINNNPMRAVEILCEIPKAYYQERNIQPWFTRWKSLYRKTSFSPDLNQYLRTHDCLAVDLLSR